MKLAQNAAQARHNVMQAACVRLQPTA